MSQTTYMPVAQSSQSQNSAPFQGFNFPGNRSQPQYAGYGPSPDKVLLKTAGNALQAVCRHEIHDDDDLMAVCCPENVRAGDRLRVLAPDGSGRQVETVVPIGVSTGHTFLVRLPPRPEQFLGNDSDPVFVVGTPASPSQHEVVPGTDLDDATGPQIALTDMTPVPPPVATPVDASTAPPASAITDQQGQDLILVTVPPNSHPGHKLHVPTDDGRMIEAVVPPGATEFYVRVPPRTENLPQGQPKAQRVMPMRLQPDQPSRPQRSTKPEEEADKSLMLVQVPEGSSAGDKLQVKTSDGRVIEAIIPPGNIKVFYIRVPPPQTAPATNDAGQVQEQACSPLGVLGAYFGMTD